MLDDNDFFKNLYGNQSWITGIITEILKYQ